MNTIIAMADDPRPTHREQESRSDSGELQDTTTRGSSEASSKSEVNERIDYSYDPDDEWVDMHPGRNTEENY